METFEKKLKEAIKESSSDMVGVSWISDLGISDIIDIVLENPVCKSPIRIRLHNVYSRMMHPSIIGYAIVCIKEHASPFKLIDHYKRVSFLYWEDAIRAVVRLSKEPRAWGRSVEVASNIYTPLIEVYDKLFEIAKWTPSNTEKEQTLIPLNRKRGEGFKRIDTDLFMKLTGFYPEIPLAVGLKKAYESVL